MKICPKCKEKKSLDSFIKDKRTKDGRTYVCKVCTNTYSREFYRKNIEKERARSRERTKRFPEKRRDECRRYYVNNKYRIRNRQKMYEKNNRAKRREYESKWRANNRHKTKVTLRKHELKKAYGITLEQYDSLLEKQKGVCAICGNTCSSGRRLAVDHDHKTGKVRGLLCGGCNMRLPLVEDKALLNKALEYLRRSRHEN